MKSITSWIERNLYLKVNAEKSKVVRPTNSHFLGFTYWKREGKWRLRVGEDRKARIKGKVRKVLTRANASVFTLGNVIYQVNQTVKGWINYYAPADMKTFVTELGCWIRHRTRVIIVRSWKRPRTIFENLTILNRIGNCGYTPEQLRIIANSRLGPWRMCGMPGINKLISPQVLGTPNKKRHRPGLVDPLEFYLGKHKT